MTRWKDTLPPIITRPSLKAAAYHLTQAFHTPPGSAAMHASIAAAHIRAVRKQIEAEHGITSDRVGDWHPGASDERILWGALMRVSEAAYYGSDPFLAAACLRVAEEGLRTLWRRGQS